VSATNSLNKDLKTVPYMPGTDTSPLEPQIVEALRTVYDPEIPVNVFDLGLIYDLKIDEQGAVKLTMTLTTPACPVAGELPSWIEHAIKSINGVSRVEIELVWDPFWKPEYMTEDARLQLGLW
jgi:FeS assembly SUF system protein